MDTKWDRWPRGLVEGDGLKLKLGAVEIELTDLAMGTVTVNGERFPLEGLRITCVPGEPIRISMDYAARG